MAKKPIEEKHELVKFIKNLYTEEIQLNFAQYFEIYNKDGNIFNLNFPKSQYYRMDGTIDLSACPNFVEWMHKDSNGLVCVDNAELDDLRKLKMSEFIDIEKDNDKYQINLTNNKFTLLKFTNDNKPFDLNQFTIQADIPESKLTESLITVYLTKDNQIVFDYDQDYTVLLDSSIKNIKVIFKKDAKYSIYATEPDENGFRYVAVEGKGELVTLRQYFRVI